MSASHNIYNYFRGCLWIIFFKNATTLNEGLVEIRMYSLNKLEISVKKENINKKLCILSVI